MKRVLIPIILATALSACRSSIGPEEETGAIVIDIPMRNERLTPQKPARADIIASLDTIRLGGTVDETLLSEVSDIKFSSDRIFVLSADVLCIFDLDGRYVPPMFGTIYLKPFVLDVNYYDIIERPSAYGPSAEQRMYQWTTKAKEWEYEQEVRLIMPKPSQAYAALTPEQVKHPKEVWDPREIHHYMPLKGDCFESIYFGVNIDQTEKDTIIKYARKKLNPQINLYRMRVDDNAFKLQPERCPLK